MPRIIVATNDNHALISDPRAMTTEFLSDFMKVSSRVLWMAMASDIVVLPHLPTDEMKRYVLGHKGVDPASVTIITPEWNGATPMPLSRDVLIAPALLEKLRSAMSTHDPRDWTMVAYCHERGAHLMAQKLGITSERLSFMGEGGSELINDKRVFRSLAAARAIPLASGTVASCRDDLAFALAQYLPLTGCAILKQDRAFGGFGNLIVRIRKDDRSPAKESNVGASDVVYLDPDADHTQAIDAIWQRLAPHERAHVVVEAYEAVSHVLSAEFRLTAADRGAEFLNWCGVRQEPVYCGVEMPPAVPSYIGARFMAAATEVARLAVDLGYEGLINIDGIALPNGKAIINEFNGRFSGYSHIHEIGVAAAGPDYGDRLVLASYKAKTHLSIAEILALLERERIGFDPQTNAGVVIAAEDVDGSGKIDFVTFAPTREQLYAIERTFEALIAGH